MNKLTNRDVDPDKLIGRRCKLIKRHNENDVIITVEGTLTDAKELKVGRSGETDWWLSFNVTAEWLTPPLTNWSSQLETVD